GNAAFTLTSIPTPVDLFAGYALAFRFKEGKLFAEKLTEKSYGKFASFLNGDLSVSGNVSCEASFSPMHADVKLWREALRGYHPLAQFYLPELKGRTAQFSYDTLSKKWQGEIPISQAQLKLDCYTVTGIDGMAKLEKKGEAPWKLTGHFHNLSLPVNEETSIEEAHCDVAFDGESRKLCIENAQGAWRFRNGKSFTVELPKMSVLLDEKKALDFCLKVLHGNKEFACLEGKAAQTASGWTVEMLSHTTHFGGTLLHIRHCALNPTLCLTEFEMEPVFKCKDMPSQAA